MVAAVPLNAEPQSPFNLAIHDAHCAERWAWIAVTIDASSFASMHDRIIERLRHAMAHRMRDRIFTFVRVSDLRNRSKFFPAFHDFETSASCSVPKHTSTNFILWSRR